MGTLLTTPLFDDSSPIRNAYTNVKPLTGWFGWICELTAYWIFTINVLMYNSKYFQAPDGTNVQGWYNVYKFGFIPLDFGGIDIVYLIKNVGLMFITGYHISRDRFRGRTSMSGVITPDGFWIDLVTYFVAAVFWLVSTIYFYDRNSTNKSTTDWSNIFVLPVVKLIVDVLLVAGAAVVFRKSYTCAHGIDIIWMDLQYLFIYLQLSGKVVWDNPFIMYVWIFMATIVLMIALLVSLIGLIILTTLDKNNRGMLLFDILVFCLLAQVVLFFTWSCIVGSNTSYLGNVHYLLLASCILCTISMLGQSFLYYNKSMFNTRPR